MGKKEQETVIVELLIRFEGSNISNRITTFELPIVARVESGSDMAPEELQFETRALVKAIRAATWKLI